MIKFPQLVRSVRRYSTATGGFADTAKIFQSRRQPILKSSQLHKIKAQPSLNSQQSQGFTDGATLTQLQSLLKTRQLLQFSPSVVDVQGEKMYDIVQEELVTILESPALATPVSDLKDSTNLYDALVRIIARELAVNEVERAALVDVFSEIFLNSEDVRHGAVGDITKCLHSDPAAFSILQPLVFFKGLHATTVARCAHELWTQGTFQQKQTALLLQSRASVAYAVDIHPGAELGKAIFLDHAHGLVIGETSVLGNNIVLLHGITLGGTGKDRGKRHPTIGNDVVIGEKATVLGNITLGDGVRVGAQAIVTKNIAAGQTVIGTNKVLNPTAEDTGYYSWFYEI